MNNELLERWNLHGFIRRKNGFVTKEVRYTRASGCSKTPLFPTLVLRKQRLNKKRSMLRRLSEQLRRDVLFVAELPPMEDFSAGLVDILGGFSEQEELPNCDVVNFDVLPGKKTPIGKKVFNVKKITRAQSLARERPFEDEDLGRIETAIDYVKERGVVWATSKAVQTQLGEKIVPSENVFGS